MVVNEKRAIGVVEVIELIFLYHMMNPSFLFYIRSPEISEFSLSSQYHILGFPAYI
jgi:hypothetical protein